MKTFLIVYTQNNSIGSDQIYNIELSAIGIADVIEQARIKIGDTIIIINVIEL